ncbi:AraC family transcriptional regulator [Paenibacillus sp. 1P07SE]|uniref:helix-turn-helix transcriptional regulator n=1 Tax=Paenibacillus sp. 1P07SE TaxID=3132209 RepID=UPI0039A670CB
MNKEQLKEKRLHGDPLYPANLYDYAPIGSEPLMELHWHIELELLLVTSGSATFRVGIQEYQVKAGEALFINSGELHEALEASGCAFRALVFHPDLIRSAADDTLQVQYLDPLLQGRHRAPVHMRGDAAGHRDILELLERLLQLHEEKPLAYELMAKGMLLLILSLLYQQGEPAADRTRVAADQYKMERLKQAIGYIQTHYGEAVRLRDMAASVSMSEAYFCRFFKDMTSRNPVDYLNQYRMQKAAHLIRTTDAKMTDIAMDVGFNHLSYFIGVFKQHYGCTPSVYRKAAGELLETTLRVD